MYFSSHGYLLYNDFGANTNNVVTNIFKRAILRHDLITESSNYYEYTMRENETLESISNRLYGDPYYYFVLLYLNNLFDPQWDLSLSEGAFNDYIVSKYGSVQDAKNFDSPYTASYTSTGNLLTVNTTPQAHGLFDGRKVRLTFSRGSILNGIYTVDVLTNMQFRVTLSQSLDDGEGSVEVSPPYLKYYIKNNEADSSFLETDKDSYDQVTNAALRTTEAIYDVESKENFNRRIIKVLKPEVLEDFITQFKDKLK